MRRHRQAEGVYLTPGYRESHRRLPSTRRERGRHPTVATGNKQPAKRRCPADDLNLEGQQWHRSTRSRWRRWALLPLVASFPRLTRSQPQSPREPEEAPVRICITDGRLLCDPHHGPGRPGRAVLGCRRPPSQPRPAPSRSATWLSRPSHASSSRRRGPDSRLTVRALTSDLWRNSASLTALLRARWEATTWLPRCCR